ncbi:hypothetical protein [Gemmata sp.]|uniref:hypothetical protein n=1 Tax=Gemmata sp. TaxID=1914242 RepID=UPI003F6E6C09
MRIITTPAVWVAWPFLPLIRTTPNGVELGVMFDAMGTVGRTGFSATVLFANLFNLPPTVDQLLELPREVFDYAEELIQAGWRVD